VESRRGRPLAPPRKLEEIDLNVSHTKPFVSLRDVTVRLHGRALFEGLDWEIESDQHWAVVGPNGSGKSALMKVLAGELPASGGEIVYHFLQQGEAPHEQIAYVSFDEQRSMLGPEAFLQDRWNIGLRESAPTVADVLSERNIHHSNPFIVEAPILKKKTEISGFNKKRTKLIAAFGLKRLLTERMVELSNGERRKVSIARALLKNPKLLILDNPFEGLDVKFRATFKKNLETLMKGDVRVIIVGTGREEIPSGITHVLRIGEDHTVSVGLCNEILPDVSSKNGLPPNKKKPTGNKSSKILVAMKNVNVSYNKVPVLRKLSWTVREGEKWALFGPNGAGKTTLLSLILGDNPQAYANDITLFGKRRGSGESIWEIKRKIGWVSPELQLYYPAEATCLDVVCSGFFDTVGLYRAPSPRQEKVARSWLKKFGLAERADALFEDISEGEERLVLLARALVKSPKLLVLDEPCQGLDTANRDRVLAAVDSVAGHSAMTMIYVTHRTDELPSSITHTLRLQAAGKPARIDRH